MLRKCRLLCISAELRRILNIALRMWTYETMIIQMGEKTCLFRKREQIYKPSKAKLVCSELSLQSFRNVHKVRFVRNKVRILVGRFIENTEETKEE
jgi:hypothetical protein